MKVGVTGGSGFIGGWVVDELRVKGHDVVIFDPRGRKELIDTNVELRLGDVRDSVAVTEFAAHVDGIIHLAAVLGTQETIKNPRPAFETNGIGGLNVLEACHQYDIPLVNICVGNYWMNNSYSITKNTFERVVEMFVKENGTRAANVRCVNAYGPRQSAAPPFASGQVRKIMPSFICRALSGMPIEVYGDGSQVSDCVYVADVALVLVNAFEALASGKQIEGTLEVGPEEHDTVQGIAELVSDIVSIKTDETPVDIINLPMRPGEIPGAEVTCNPKTLEQIGVQPSDLTWLSMGLDETVDYFIRTEGKTWNRP